MNAFDVCTVTIPLGSVPTGGTVIFPVFKAPASTQGGGVTILASEVVPATATNAGTGWAVTAVNGGTLGTVLGGTIASKVGGTAAAALFAANTIAAMTVQSTNTLAAGEYLALKITQEGATDVPDGVMIVQYIHGR